MKKHILKMILAAGFFAAGAAQAETENEFAASLPATLSCKQVVAVYGRFAADRIRTVPTVKMIAEDILFTTKGSLDNEVVITLGIDGEQVTDLIFTIEDLKAVKSGKTKDIRGLYRESASYHDTWVDALTVVDCN
jgi:hypothetical protein